MVKSFLGTLFAIALVGGTLYGYNAITSASSRDTTPRQEQQQVAMVDTATPTETAISCGPLVTCVASAATTIPPSSTPVPVPPTATAVSPASTSVPAVPTAPASVVTNCPTDDQMQAALGFDRMNPLIKPVATGAGIPWEGCKWNWQSNEKTTLDFDLPANWQATISRAEDGKVQVFYGPAHLNVRGFTLRFRPAYNTRDNRWVNDPCEVLRREQVFGQMPERGNLRYDTESGNVTCATSSFGSSSGTSTGSINTTWLSTNIGGDASKWQTPTWSGGAWVFKDKGHPVSLKYPGSGNLDVWLGNAVSITTANANLLNGQTFDEASFHP